VISIEEIAYNKGYISNEQMKSLAHTLIKSEYGKYLAKLIRCDLKS
jgi:glucose-1-phosphate thymidylyltransferase